MSTTGSALLTGFSTFLGDVTDPVGLTTSAAGDSAGTTLIDDTLGEYEDDALVGRWIRITTTGTNQYLVRRIIKNESASGLVEVNPPFAAQVASSIDYELHRYDPRGKFTALDEARVRVFDVLARTIYDDTTTADGHSRVFPIPSTIRSGPVLVQQECVTSPSVNWNYLAAPLGDSTTGYTATGTTATTVSRSDTDLLVPRVGDSCTKLVTAASQAATYSLLIASAANSLTAALAADRKMTYARWVYCTEASKVRLGIIDDASSTITGSFHGGGGWELLTVEKTIAGNNATLLSAVISIASTASASTIYAEYGWWYFGSAERVRDSVWSGDVPKRTRRDDTTQQVYLDWVPPRGRQLRFIGRETLTALGTAIATQVTNAMEVDEENAQILYAEAAKIMFGRLGLNLSDFASVSQNIAYADSLKKRMVNSWAQESPVSRIKGMWAR